MDEMCLELGNDGGYLIGTLIDSVVLVWFFVAAWTTNSYKVARVEHFYIEPLSRNLSLNPSCRGLVSLNCIIHFDLYVDTMFATSTPMMLNIVSVSPFSFST